MGAEFDVWQFAKDLGAGTILFICLLGYFARKELLKKFDDLEIKQAARAKDFYAKFEKTNEKVNNLGDRMTRAETDIEHVAGTRWEKKK